MQKADRMSEKPSVDAQDALVQKADRMSEKPSVDAQEVLMKTLHRTC